MLIFGASLKFILPQGEGWLFFLPSALFLGLFSDFSGSLLLCYFRWCRLLVPLTVNKISLEDCFFSKSLTKGLTWLGLVVPVWVLVFQKLCRLLIKETEYVIFLSKIVYFYLSAVMLILLFIKWLMLYYAYYKGEQLLGELQVKKRKH